LLLCTHLKQRNTLKYSESLSEAIKGTTKSNQEKTSTSFLFFNFLFPFSFPGNQTESNIKIISQKLETKAEPWQTPTLYFPPQIPALRAPKL
jgi:hypothetical protein